MYKELLDTREIDGFTVEIYACDEHMHPDQLFDWQDDKHRTETLEWMESKGLIGWFCAMVQVSKNGVNLAADYLGGCSYDSVQSFLKDAYCEGMIDQALAEAKDELPQLIDKLSA